MLLSGGPPGRCAVATYEPLRGLRVLSFETVFSLPSATRTMAELGADVVRVSAPDAAAGDFVQITDSVFLAKRCVAIDLTHERGADVARRLAGRADVVCSNLRPSVMERFGLGPERLLADDPALIVLTLSGFGRPGPWQDLPAFGSSVEAAGGMYRLMGGPDDLPARIGSEVFADQLAGRQALLAVLTALRRRRETGRGVHVDVSMYECIAHLLGEFLLRTARTGELREQHGNRDPVMAPQGVYPCAGTDEWVAISVVDDDAWVRFTGVVDDPGLADPALRERAVRHERHDELDDRIAAWTAGRPKHEVAARLQAAGVAAAPVQKPGDLFADEHLAARQVFQTVSHASPVLGFAAHPHHRMAWRSTGHDRADLSDMHWGGQDDEVVLREWLGMAPEEIAALLQDGALVDAGALRPPPFPPRGRLVEGDFAARLDLPEAAP